MDFYDVVKSRRTIREFCDKKVDKEIIERILSAGLMAPTNDHLRNWEFVVILEKEIIEKIISPLPKTISKKELDSVIETWEVGAPFQKEMYENAIPKQYKMLIQSECLILPFFKQESPLLKPENLSALNNFASIWCCLENIMLAATVENLGCAMRIPFEKETEHIFETIKHPKEYFMPCYLAIGYPLSNNRTPEQIKQNIKEKIHYNKW
ncbi:MAG: nitroreductase family protein [Chitinispirillales bacterium]|nr:nitroreductase family protein [Chitinispirillales bacterium]